VIEIRSVTKTYPPRGRAAVPVTALDDVSLDVPAGQVMGVVGPSGSGKSTLVRCVNLLERPTSGTVHVDGEDLTALPAARLRDARRRIGMIFQHFNLLDSRTAAGNVEHPLELAGVPGRQRRDRAAELLARVGLSDKASAHPGQLSGGQKQRVAIARALAARPTVLLCDEATSALDPDTTGQILDLLRRLTDELGLTTLLITHEMDVVKRACDRVALLRDGRVVDSGPLAEVIDRPASPLAAQLLPALPPATPSVVGTAVAELTLTGDPDGPSTVSELVRRFDVEVDVLAGRVETIAGRRAGRLQLQLRGEQAAVTGAVAWAGDRETAGVTR